MDLSDIELTVDDDGTQDPLFTIVVTTPFGRLRFMGLVELADRQVWIDGLHVEGPGARSWGIRRLLGLGAAIAEKLDVDEIIVNGAVRTTGANPGRRPNRIRIARQGASSRKPELPDS